MHLQEAEGYRKGEGKGYFGEKRKEERRPGGCTSGIFWRRVPPGCLNSDPISDLKMSFSTLVLRPVEAEITMSSLERLSIACTANVRFKLRNF